MARWTKKELEREVETLRMTIEEAQAVLSVALGYDEVYDGDEADDRDESKNEAFETSGQVVPTHEADGA